MKKELVSGEEDMDWIHTEKKVFELASNHPFLVGMHSCFQVSIIPETLQRRSCKLELVFFSQFLIKSCSSNLEACHSSVIHEFTSGQSKVYNKSIAFLILSKVF